MTRLYTWDYTALITAPRSSASQTLLDLGYLTKVENVAPKKYAWEPGPPKKVISYEITDEGRRWVAAIENRWEAQCEGTRWWSVEGTPGVFVIALMEGMHPSEVESDLRTYFGSTFQFSDARDEDSCEGNPILLEKSWRPWKEWKPFLDLRDEDSSRHHMKGAFMRLYGSPLDSALGMYEAAGQEPSSRNVDLQLARAVARLPGPEILDAARFPANGEEE